MNKTQANGRGLLNSSGCDLTTEVFACGYATVRKFLKNRWHRNPTDEQVEKYFRAWVSAEGPNSFANAIAIHILELMEYSGNPKKVKTSFVNFLGFLKKSSLLIIKNCDFLKNLNQFSSW